MRLVFCIISCLVLLPVAVYSETSLSVISVEGLDSMRFGRVQNQPANSQARVRLNGDGGRFELRQRLLDDFRNERQETLDRGAVTFYTLNGSNSHGTLYQGTPVSLDTSERVLYTSSTQGESDSLIVVYQVDPERITASGDFSARIMLTMQPISSGAQQNVILNCSLTVDRKATFSINTTSHNSRLLRLSKVDGQSQGEAQITLDAVLGKPYQITQIISEPFKNERQEIFPLDKISFSAAARVGQVLTGSAQALSQKPTHIYSSTSNGSVDIIGIVYMIKNDALDIPSGTFSGTVFYLIESGSATITRMPLKMQFEILPLFEIKILPQTESGLSFENIQAGVTIEKQVVLEVASNRNKPYTVVQRITAPLTNELGETIPFDALKVRSECLPDMPGDALLSSDTAVGARDLNVFISDTGGSPSRFIVRYFLTGPANARSGNYFTKISFSLVEN